MERGYLGPKMEKAQEEQGEENSWGSSPKSKLSTRVVLLLCILDIRVQEGIPFDKKVDGSKRRV